MSKLMLAKYYVSNMQVSIQSAGYSMHAMQLWKMPFNQSLVSLLFIQLCHNGWTITEWPGRDVRQKL